MLEPARGVVMVLPGWPLERLLSDTSQHVYRHFFSLTFWLSFGYSS